MDSIRYFYSVDGTDSLGPVGADAIRRLCEQRILNESSLVCPEGGKKWKPLVPQDFAPSLAKDWRAPETLVQPVRELAKKRTYTRTYNTGGMGRLTFLFWVIVIGVVKIWLLGHLSPPPHTNTMTTYISVQVADLFVGLIVTCLRLDDMGRSRWLCALIFIPIVNVALFFYLLLATRESVAREGDFKFGVAVIVLLVACLVFIGEFITVFLTMRPGRGQ